MKKLCFYVPQAQLESVKEALFEAGAGRIGLYGECCWQVLGQGQFRPLAGSDPHLGREGALERVPEYRVEMLLGDSSVDAVLEALYRAHPYEEPAWDISEVRAPGDFERRTD